jgi:hypothetical protein
MDPIMKMLELLMGQDLMQKDQGKIIEMVEINGVWEKAK